MAQAAELRQAWREARGASLFVNQDPGLRFESVGGAAPSVRLVDGPRRAPGARSASQQLVTEMMILANEAAATLGADDGLGIRECLAAGHGDDDPGQ